MPGLIEKLDALIAGQEILLERVEKLEGLASGLAPQLNVNIDKATGQGSDLPEVDDEEEKRKLIGTLAKLAGMVGCQQPAAILQSFGTLGVDELKPEQYQAAITMANTAIRRAMESVHGA